MIPDHLINKAAEAISHTALFRAHRREDYPPELLALAALEAVAADIWAQGFDAGERDVWEHEHGSYDDPCIPNPYKETA